MLADSTAHVTDTGSLALTAQVDPFATGTGSHAVQLGESSITATPGALETAAGSAAASDQPGTEAP